MKRFMFAVMAVVVLGFTACEKGENEKPEFSVNGEVYAAFAYIGGGFTIGGYTSPEYNVYWVFRFLPDNKVERTARENDPQGGIIGDVEMGTYELNYPNITITMVDGYSGVKTGVFIDEDTFRIGTGDNIDEYIKQ